MSESLVSLVTVEVRSRALAYLSLSADDGGGSWLTVSDMPAPSGTRGFQTYDEHFDAQWKKIHCKYQMTTNIARF